VRGPAHEESGLPCQDYCLGRAQTYEHGTVLVLACADGAGSVRYADVGARAACLGVVHLVLADLEAGLAVERIDRPTVLAWHRQTRRHLRRCAARLEADLDELACTLLLAVVGERAAAFSHVGDGAVVALERGAYHPVFWPQWAGEEDNSTNFVTNNDYAKRLEFELRIGRVDELALLTDGVQVLALNGVTRTAQQMFFGPVFERMRATKHPEKLARALRKFFGSPAVRARSDDDKTLVLATRLTENGAG
jgi:hypothetical protein